MDKPELRWVENKSAQCLELYDKDEMVAFITERPSYCDRGHYLAVICGAFEFDECDCRPNYYMKLQIAKDETFDFILWRRYKQRAEPYGQLHDYTICSSQ